MTFLFEYRIINMTKLFFEFFAPSLRFFNPFWFPKPNFVTKPTRYQLLLHQKIFCDQHIITLHAKGNLFHKILSTKFDRYNYMKLVWISANYVLDDEIKRRDEIIGFGGSISWYAVIEGSLMVQDQNKPTNTQDRYGRKLNFRFLQR